MFNTNILVNPHQQSLIPRFTKKFVSCRNRQKKDPSLKKCFLVFHSEFIYQTDTILCVQFVTTHQPKCGGFGGLMTISYICFGF